jgi:hypothetical protein
MFTSGDRAVRGAMGYYHSVAADVLSRFGLGGLTGDFNPIRHRDLGCGIVTGSHVTLC